LVFYIQKEIIMGATTTQGTGNGSASNIKPLILNGSVKTANIEPNAVTAAKLDNNASSKAPLVLNTAAITLNSSFAGIPLVFTRAAGVVVTLPAATGTGDIYKFYVNTTVTSNSYKIQVANATDIISGLALADDGDGEPANGWPTTSTTDTITMDGSTQGGIKGDSLEIIDIASGQFCVRAFLTNSGTEATPFSAAVS
jgi:hypothetical protein